MRSIAMWSASAVVPTRKVPDSAISSMVSSLASDPCSMQSTPARMQARIPASPWAWAATRRPLRCASSTMAASSSSEYCWAPGRRAEGHHAARGRDLDQLGPVLHLVADRLAHLGHAVGDARLHALRHDAGRQPLEHGGVEVAAGRGDGVAGREDARAGEPALVDGLGQVHVEQEAGRVDHQTQVAHGREAGHQRRVAVHRAAQRPVDRRVLHPVHRVGQPVGAARPPDEHVELHVHQPGQQGDVAQVDLGRRRRELRRVRRRRSGSRRSRCTAGERTSPATTSSQRSARRMVTSLIGSLLTDRLVAAHGGAVHLAPGGGVVGVHPVHDAGVVPNDQVARPSTRAGRRARGPSTVRAGRRAAPCPRRGPCRRRGRPRRR